MTIRDSQVARGVGFPLIRERGPQSEKFNGKGCCGAGSTLRAQRTANLIMAPSESH